MNDELSGDGTIITDGEVIATVYYWLTVMPKSGAVIAEGSITGAEEVMRRIKKSTAPKMALAGAPQLNCDATEVGPASAG
jgi:hypothetical protein